jgi:Holliday junction resolvase RusA-like endonuclease
MRPSPIFLTLPYPPSVNHMYVRTRGGWLGLSPDAALYRATVRSLLSGSQPIMEGPVSLRVDVYRRRRHGDLDNTLKALLDALNGLVYRDDSQVVEILARRNW